MMRYYYATKTLFLDHKLWSIILILNTDTYDGSMSTSQWTMSTEHTIVCAKNTQRTECPLNSYEYVYKHKKCD